MHEYDKSSKWLIQHHGDSILRLAGSAGIRRLGTMASEGRPVGGDGTGAIAKPELVHGG